MPAKRIFLPAITRRVALHPYFAGTLGAAFCVLSLAVATWLVWEQRLSRPLSMGAASEPYRDTLSGWPEEAAWTGSIAVFGCLVVVIIIFLAVRWFHDQHAVFGTALENMNEGLMMFDRTNRLLLANTAVLRIFGLRFGDLHPGMSVVDVIGAVVKVNGALDQPTSIVDFYMQMVQRNLPTRFRRKLPDGRQLAGNFAPHDNGWIITYEDMTEASNADERIAHMAMHDALTGLPNRLMLRTRTEEALAAIGGNGSFAIICLDLDHFKDVNDTLGHPAGDKLLCEVVRRIRSVVRPIDLVARLGGDEFAIVLSEVSGKVAVANMAIRLVETIGTPYELNGQSVFVGASLGIAIATIDGADPDTLMKNADMALYRAKNEGRGRFAFFEPSMQQLVIERHRIGRELYNAMSAGDLELYYQPIVKVWDRTIVGFEALMRWHHPTRGTISPAEFVPVAESNGFIVQLGRWALNTACRDAMRWPDDLKVAVNLSPVQFRSGTLVLAVAGALKASGLAANRLELEITESTMMSDTDATLATLEALKVLGVRIAMDDFGTGYSSLAYLQKFPFDKIKIDRAFIVGIEQATNLAIVRAVTGIAESMGIITTAEGIETEDQFAAVTDARCTEAQGYLFSPARAASEISALLGRQELPGTSMQACIQDAVTT